MHVFLKSQYTFNNEMIFLSSDVLIVVDTKVYEGVNVLH